MLDMLEEMTQDTPIDNSDFVSDIVADIDTMTDAQALEMLSGLDSATREDVLKQMGGVTPPK